MSEPLKSEAIVIGASAGAIDALMMLLPVLPANYPLPIMIVVHLPPDKKSVMAEIFQARCKIPVREAEDKEPVVPGTIYFAPPDYHLLVENNRHLSLSVDEPVYFSRPSIDVLFETAADAYGPALTGIILTGANDDGAKGLRAVLHSGGQGLIQTPEKAYAATMPEAAIGVNPRARVMDLTEIASTLQTLGTP